MCQSDDVAAENETSPSREETSPEAKVDDDFTFGTTQPLELPVVVPKVLSETQQQSPDQSHNEIQSQTQSEQQYQPHNQAQSQTQSERPESLEADDEFTFGTTNPLGLPDFSKDAAVDTQPDVNSITVCTASNDQESWDIVGAYAIPHHYTSWYDPSQVIESRPLTGQFPSESFRQPVAVMLQPPFGYTSPVVSSIDPGYWSHPAPSVSYPMALPYCTMPLETEPVASYNGSINYCAQLDSAETQDIQRDPETGLESEACSMYVHQLKSRSFTPSETSKTRRIVAALCICILLICMLAVVAVLVLV